MLPQTKARDHQPLRIRKPSPPQSGHLNLTMEALPNNGPMPGGYGQPSSALPILAIDGDIGEFDYSAFLDEHDLNYLAESSESMATPPTSSSPSSATLSDAPPQRLAPQQQRLAPSTALTVRSPGNVAGRNTNTERQVQHRQRLERRGHTKSRRGCFNCKRRRIKARRPGETDKNMQGLMDPHTSARRRSLHVGIASSRDSSASTPRFQVSCTRYGLFGDHQPHRG
jgi:hypothetical protein